MANFSGNLYDILDHVNILRTKMSDHGLPISTDLTEKTIEELSRYDDKDATLILGSRGFEDPRINELVDSISKKTLQDVSNFETSEESGEWAGNLIRKFHDDTVREIIETEILGVEQRAQDDFRESCKIRWEKEKVKLIEAIELTQGQCCFKPCSFNNDKLTATYPSILSRSSVLNEDEVQFARLVHDYVSLKLSMGSGLNEQLSKFCVPPGEKSDEIWELWRLIGAILFDSDEGLSTISFINSCLNFLQIEFRSFLRKQVMTNLTGAELGGVPGIFSLVRGYMSLTNHNVQAPLVEGKPAWKFVYLCLRCGDRKAALRASMMARLPNIWIQLLEGVTMSLDQLRGQYKHQNNVDPYQRICFCLMDPDCDPNNTHSEIADSIEDFLWLKLHQANTDSSAHRFTALQTQIREEFGEKYFVNSPEQGVASPLLYCQCLLLTGQFEHAMELLCRYPQGSLFVHAVHMAIVLYECQRLNVTTEMNYPLLTGNTFNLHKLIKIYAEKRFALGEDNDELTALMDYFYLLKPFTCKQNTEMEIDGFTHALAHLDLSSKQFQKIYGLTDSPSRRYQALIDVYTQDSTEVLSFVADSLERRAGNLPTLMSATLRLLANKYDIASDNVCELLSSARLLCIDGAAKNSELQALETMKFAEQLVGIVSSGGLDRCESYQNLSLTYQVAKFFVLFNTRNYRAALDLMRQLRIIALNSEEVESCVHRFDSISDILKFSISDILEATAVCLQKIYKCGDSEEHYTQASVQSLREQTNALIRYSGSIPFHIRSTVSTRLLQLCSSCPV